MQCRYCNTQVFVDNTSIFKCPNPDCGIINVNLSSPERIYPHKTLKSIVEIYGVNILDEKIIIRGLLMDTLPYENIRNVLLLAIKEDFHHQIKKLNLDPENDLRLNRLKLTLSNKYFFYKETSDYAIEALAYALGKINQIDQKLLNQIIKLIEKKLPLDKLSTYKNVQPVKILMFKTKENYIFEDQIFHIEWDALNITRAYLNAKEIPTNKKEIEAIAKGYEKFELKVINDYFQEKAYLEVNPLPKPKILFFQASNTIIKKNEEIIFSWEVKNAKKIILSYNGKNLDVTKEKEFKIQPDQSFEIELKAYSVDSLFDDSNKIRIEVIQPVEIKSFNSNKTRILEGDEIELSWNVKNAKEIILLPINKKVVNVQNYKTTPLKSTTYILRASNELYVEEKEIPVMVYPLPLIKELDYPTLPNLNFSLPNFDFDPPIQQPLIYNFQKAKWYHQLFSLELSHLSGKIIDKLSFIFIKIQDFYSKLQKQFSNG